MLKELYIENIALIEKETIEFYNGLNVLSGETGAGKSIIIDSLEFVLGGKVNKNIIKSGEERAVVRAYFCLLSGAERDALNELLGEISNEILLFRNLNSEGKTENKINGRSVPLNIYKQAGNILMDILGQNENQKLIENKEQLSLLDLFTGTEADKYKVSIADKINEINNIKKEIAELGGDDEKRLGLIDYLKYQISEIENAKLEEGEEDKLTEKLLKIQNSEKIYEGVSGAVLSLSGEELNVPENISRAISYLNSISKFSGEYGELAKRLTNVRIETEDILDELNKQDLEKTSEKEIDRITNRLDEYKNLKRKYGGNISGVIRFLENARNKLNNLENASSRVAELQNGQKLINEELKIICGKLTELRKQKALEFETRVKQEAEMLNIKHVQFKVVFKDILPNKNGADEICFMFSANLGFNVMPLSEVASGGELSRLSLAIKTVIMEKDSITSMVFDEADEGISGKTGLVLAERMARISRNNQVILITHLAQVAAMADYNYLITKEVVNGKTQTAINLLNKEQAESEITRLLSGTDNSIHAHLHAKELLENAKKFKNS